MSATSSSTKATQPVSKPVTLLTDQLALFYTNLHPILILSPLLFSFSSLVQDPVNTLLGLAPSTALVQAFYCILCLPSSGQTPSSTPKPGQKKKPAKPAQDIWAKAVPALLSFVLTLFLSAPLLYIIIVLFGAPLVSHQLHTFLAALHLALLTTPPLFYVHGLDAPTWLRLASLQQPVDEVFGMALGACLGTWVGAIPIPLDWDRDWQRWPVTVVCGLYFGAVLGKLAGGYVFRGAKIKMS